MIQRCFSVDGFLRRRRKTSAGAVLFSCLVLLFPNPAAAQILTGYRDDIDAPLPASAERGEVDKDAPVDIAADDLRHDDATKTVTASGHVVLTQGGRKLTADEISYNTATDTVTARGNVMLTEPNGDVHVADGLELSREMKIGVVRGFQTYLVEGGHFVAREGVRGDGKITMRDASYTPCECETDEDGAPAWQIRAKEVTYDEENHRISYKHARFEIFGVPVAWTPILSHPDGKVKRKSGFLTPQFGYDSGLGVVVTNRYYWDIAPNRDMTAGVMLTQKEKPVGLLEYRHRFDQATMQFIGSATRSGRTDSVGGESVSKGDDMRGHLFADGLWDVSEKWRAGTKLEMASDDQYLRQYDISSKDVLENEVYAERFSGRNYAVGRVLAFQDVRIREEQTDQPDVLPEVATSFIGRPNGVLGGRWDMGLSALGLRREAGGQDMNRLSAEAGWQRRHITGFGLVNTVRASVRADAYSTGERDVATPGSGRSRDGTETRLFPRIHAVSSLPFSKPLERAQLTVGPVAALTLSPHINVEDGSIPNEDSQDVQIDAGNLFEANRFPGKDRVEDGTHATYGLRLGAYGYQGSYIDVFGGQSYRFGEKDNPFPDGSGLSRQRSDFVGQVAARYDESYGINYRFQIDSYDLSSQRHEFEGYADWERMRLNTRYLFAKALEGTDIEESREQIENAAAFRLAGHWWLRGSALHDLGQSPGLRKASVGIDYFGCCLSFSTTAERKLTEDASGDSGTDVTFRVGLKGLGEFRTAESERRKEEERWGK